METNGGALPRSKIEKNDQGNNQQAVQRLHPKGIVKELEKESCSTSVWRTVFSVPSAKSTHNTYTIHPSSPFMMLITFANAVFLAYTALVVPLVLAFMLDWPACKRSPILTVDLVVDSFFMLEFFLSFFTAFEKAHGKLIDGHLDIARKFLRGPFIFDLVTSFPVAYMELYLLLSCGDASFDPSVEAQQLRIIKVVKPVRFLRLTRVLRAFKTKYDMVYEVAKALHVSEGHISMLKILVGLMSITHVCSCFFWIVKVWSNSSEEVIQFVVDSNLDPDATMSEKYILCFYFIVTIFTTVGFGDISANNTYEQLACILLMLCGVLVFGTLLGEVQSKIAEMRRLSYEKSQRMQQLKKYLGDKKLPVELERRILNWANFEVTQNLQQKENAQAMACMSPGQQLEVLLHVLRDEGSGERMFGRLQHPAASELHALLLASASPIIFAEGEVIVAEGENITSLHLIHEGHVMVLDSEDNLVVSLEKGDFIGEWAMMGDADASSVFGFPVHFVARTHAYLLEITELKFQEALQRMPPELQMELDDNFQDHLERAERLKEGQVWESAASRRACNQWLHLTSKLRSREESKMQWGGLRKTRNIHIGSRLGKTGSIRTGTALGPISSLAKTGSFKMPAMHKWPGSREDEQRSVSQDSESLGSRETRVSADIVQGTLTVTPRSSIHDGKRSLHPAHGSPENGAAREKMRERGIESVASLHPSTTITEASNSSELHCKKQSDTARVLPLSPFKLESAAVRSISPSSDGAAISGLREEVQRIDEKIAKRMQSVEGAVSSLTDKVDQLLALANGSTRPVASAAGERSGWTAARRRGSSLSTGNAKAASGRLRREELEGARHKALARGERREDGRLALDGPHYQARRGSTIFVAAHLRTSSCERAASSNRASSNNLKGGSRDPEGLGLRARSTESTAAGVETPHTRRTGTRLQSTETP